MRLFICIIVTLFTAIVFTNVVPAQEKHSDDVRREPLDMYLSSLPCSDADPVQEKLNYNIRRQLLDEKTGSQVVFGNVMVRSVDGHTRVVPIEPESVSTPPWLPGSAYQTVPFDVHPDDTLVMLTIELRAVSTLRQLDKSRFADDCWATMGGYVMADLVGAEDPRAAENDGEGLAFGIIPLTTSQVSSTESNDSLYETVQVVRPIGRWVKNAGSSTVRVRFYPLVPPVHALAGQYPVIHHGVDPASGNCNQIEIRTGMFRQIDPPQEPSTD